MADGMSSTPGPSRLRNDHIYWHASPSPSFAAAQKESYPYHTPCSPLATQVFREKLLKGKTSDKGENGLQMEKADKNDRRHPSRSLQSKRGSRNASNDSGDNSSGSRGIASLKKVLADLNVHLQQDLPADEMEDEIERGKGYGVSSSHANEEDDDLASQFDKVLSQESRLSQESLIGAQPAPKSSPESDKRKTRDACIETEPLLFSYSSRNSLSRERTPWSKATSMPSFGTTHQDRRRRADDVSRSSRRLRPWSTTHDVLDEIVECPSTTYRAQGGLCAKTQKLDKESDEKIGSPFRAANPVLGKRPIPPSPVSRPPLHRVGNAANQLLIEQEIEEDGAIYAMSHGEDRPVGRSPTKRMTIDRAAENSSFGVAGQVGQNYMRKDDRATVKSVSTPSIYTDRPEANEGAHNLGWGRSRSVSPRKHAHPVSACTATLLATSTVRPRSWNSSAARVGLTRHSSRGSAQLLSFQSGSVTNAGGRSNAAGRVNAPFKRPTRMEKPEATRAKCKKGQEIIVINDSDEEGHITAIDAGKQQRPHHEINAKVSVKQPRYGKKEAESQLSINEENKVEGSKVDTCPPCRNRRSGQQESQRIVDPPKVASDSHYHHKKDASNHTKAKQDRPDTNEKVQDGPLGGSDDSFELEGGDVDALMNVMTDSGW